jgi:hypothetical protein
MKQQLVQAVPQLMRKCDRLFIQRSRFVVQSCDDAPVGEVSRAAEALVLEHAGCSPRDRVYEVEAQRAANPRKRRTDFIGQSAGSSWRHDT